MTKRSGPQLDGVMDRDAFDHRPGQSRSFDLRFAFAHFINGPSLTRIKMMQSGNDTGGASLLNVLERDGILRSKPSPGRLHAAIVKRAVAKAAILGKGKRTRKSPATSLRNFRTRAFGSPSADSLGERRSRLRPSQNCRARACSPQVGIGQNNIVKRRDTSPIVNYVFRRAGPDLRSFSNDIEQLTTGKNSA